MPTWIVDCPRCGTANDVAAATVTVDCGTVSCICICSNCQNEFSAEQPYWRWLGLDTAPADEPARGKG